MLDPLFSCHFSLGRVPLDRAFDLIGYLVKENSTAPVTEALYQVNHIYNLVEKRGLQNLAAKIVVSPWTLGRTIHKCEELLLCGRNILSYWGISSNFIRKVTCVKDI